MGDNFRRDHHYVSQMYLKRWAADGKNTWTYRTLVSHSNVPIWSKRSTRGIAYHSHLYTRLGAGGESDDVEKWLDREFEAPAQEALRKVTTGERMTPDDWRRLVRFAFAQDVRTPARLIEGLQRWPDQVQEILRQTMAEVVEKCKAEQIPVALKKDSGRNEGDGTRLPLAVTTEIEPGAENGLLKAEIAVGRSLWLFHINYLLTSTVEKIPIRGWTILSPPRGLDWFTSDNPVIRLNYYEHGKYDFEGGWGKPGSEILFPLSSRHLLYNQIEKKTPHRGTEVSRPKAEELRRLIAQHAHRMVFAAEPDEKIAELRPREIDAAKLRSEQEQWKRWHTEQSQAERKLVGLRKRE